MQAPRLALKTMMFEHRGKVRETFLVVSVGGEVFEDRSEVRETFLVCDCRG